MDNVKSRDWYIDNIVLGNIIAFSKGPCMLSGRVEKIEKESVVVQTKNNSVYFVKKKEIAWVKNGSRWPVGIYNALSINRKKREVEKENGKEDQSKQADG